MMRLLQQLLIHFLTHRYCLQGKTRIDLYSAIIDRLVNRIDMPFPGWDRIPAETIVNLAECFHIPLVISDKVHPFCRTIRTQNPFPFNRFAKQGDQLTPLFQLLMGYMQSFSKFRQFPRQTQIGSVYPGTSPSFSSQRNP